MVAGRGGDGGDPGRRWRAAQPGRKAEGRAGGAAREAEEESNREAQGSAARTREAGSAVPGENGGIRSGSPRGWASKGRGNMSRVRFPRGAPARGKGREGGLPN